MSLTVYNRKRKFNKTPEPRGKKKSGQGDLRFVVQMHSATRLHFDFRLELDGVLISWAVPKGPSLNPLDQRLAIFVEDHPLDYGSFEGVIPKGNYGAGTVMLWDEGTYLERGSANRKESEIAMRKGFEKGHMTFVLDGQKLKGEFALIKLKKDKGQKAWLMVKKRDEYSTYKRSEIPPNTSVKTGRTMDEITDESPAAGAIWTTAKKRKEQLKKKPTTQTKKEVRSEKVFSLKSQKNLMAQDPLPRKNKPMLAISSRHGVEGSAWLYEPMLSGLRALAEIEGRRSHFYSRAGLSYDKKFPEIAKELSTLNITAVLDGEIVKHGKDSIYYIYDLLYFDQSDLRKMPLKARQQLLNKSLKETKHVKLISSFKGKSDHWVAKDGSSIYHSGTSKDWQILPKETVSQTTVKKSKAQLKNVKMDLPKTSSKKPAFNLKVSTSPDEPRLTHLDKIYFPKDKITKGDVLAYYESIADYILPYLKDRPESLNRHPNGISAAGFYQKDVTGYIPKWFKTERIFSESSAKTIDYAVCQDLRSLLYIANLGCIEINPWFSRIGHLDKPDFLVIDLDPDGNDFDHVIEIAHEVHNILDDIGATNVCKTSGATGIHIGVPTGAKYDFDTVRAFAESVCRIVAKKYPSTTSMDRNPQRRRKKIYLDYMQNRRGQTLAAPYCIRPRDGAPVSMPLMWKQLSFGLRPENFHIKNASAWIKKHGDPWRPILGQSINLDKCVKALERKYRLA